MPVATGTAASQSALVTSLISFLTTAAPSGPGWTLLASNTTPYSYTESNGTVSTVTAEYYLKAPGLSGTESIYLQAQAFDNASVGYYNVRLRGATGYNSAQNWFNQPGASPDTFIHLWSNSIPYTFIANGQRCLVVAQVGSIYETAYFGKFLPYGTPGQYPYPVAVGGTSISPTLLYSDTTNNHSAFFDPVCMYVYTVAGTWAPFQNPVAGSHLNQIFPYSQNVTWLEANLDGSYPLFAVILQTLPATFGSSNQGQNELGELDGVLFVPGLGQSSGSTVTVGSQAYLVAQNAFRTGGNNFAAFIEA